MRAHVQSPHLREALNGCQRDVGSQKPQEQYEPPRVEDVEQPYCIQKTDDLWRVDLLDLAFLGHGSLENERTQNRGYSQQAEQQQPALQRAEELQNSVETGMTTTH